MTSMRIDAAAVSDLHSGFAGDILLPGDPGYDDARMLFNSMIDKRPAVIAQCANADDVARAIGFARERGLEISVRGGGHGVAGTALADGGLVVDTRGMNSVTVDESARTARVGGGATLSDVDRGAQPFDLVTTTGRVSTTGIGGYTLSGGSGWLERKLGLACDNLLEVELVTAAGERVRANESENQDVFWALHGGGGNFGVATSFTFRMHEIPDVTIAFLLWPPDAGPEIGLAYREYMESAPDEIGGACLYLCPPPEEFVPEDLVGRLACGMLVTYAGTGPEADAAIEPMLGMGNTGGLGLEMPYADLNRMFDDPPGFRNYWTAEYLKSLPDEAIERWCSQAPGMVVPSPTQHLLFPQGGAVAEQGKGYPTPWRAAPWVAHPLAMWENPEDDERAISWVRATRHEMGPWASGTVYLNFIGDEGADRVRAGFGPENYERLRDVKARYDPDNVFHLNQNIRPE